MEKQVAEYGDFHFTDKITLKDLVKTTTSISYLPLEEANHEFWSWGRVVCVGDSIHKMTPNVSALRDDFQRSSTNLKLDGTRWKP